MKSQSWMYPFLETGLIPEKMIRAGIRSMLRETLRTYTEPNWRKHIANKMAFIEALKHSPIAINTEAANQQHYELPPAFFELILGPRAKYSSGLWLDETDTLEEAEENMLRLYAERAQIEDGQTILDLGCGWGSLSLWLAEHFPNAKVIGLSNSNPQREYITQRARQKNLENVTIYTGNIVDFDEFNQTRQTFDRIVSIEMFEHMKNYDLLLRKIATWLAPQGKLFVHIFSHKQLCYAFENVDGADWLTEYFFTGGTMPSDDLLLYFQRDLNVEQHWTVSGVHYQKTANAWLANFYDHKKKIMPLLEQTYGRANKRKWWVYWQLFFLACAELWGYGNGDEWMVSHYLLAKP